MLRGLYASAAGMLAQDNRHAVIAQNLANVSTSGYRKQVVGFSNFTSNLAAKLAPAVSKTTSSGTGNIVASPAIQPVNEMVSSDAREGEVRTTGNRSDLAITGNAYFTISDDNGQQYYTRNGAFYLNTKGQLVTSDGKAVLGEGGPIQIDSANWEVTPSGEVRVDGVTRDRLKLVTFDLNTASPSAGANLWKNNVVQKASTDTQVRQGALEGSNVNVMNEMIALINTTRQFEANQRCMQVQDTTLDHAVNDIAR